MINVAGHLREQNGTYQMILSWKDTTGKRRTKSISTGLPVKGNKKRAESLLRQTQKEFNPETMQQVCDLPVSEYFTRWLRESVMSLPPETYGRYAYDMGSFPKTSFYLDSLCFGVWLMKGDTSRSLTFSKYPQGNASP